MKNYFLSPQALSQAFDSVGINRRRCHADTRLALLKKFRTVSDVDMLSPPRPDCKIMIEISQVIRDVARQRSESALAFLLHQLCGKLGIPLLEHEGPSGKATLCWSAVGSSSVKFEPININVLPVDSSLQLKEQDYSATDYYLLMGETKNGNSTLFMLHADDVASRDSSPVDGRQAEPAISLDAIAAPMCFPGASGSLSDPCVISLLFSSLLCGMTDRLFSSVKTLLGTCDPRARFDQRNDSKLQNCLAYIDALLLTQDVALRALRADLATGVFNIASVLPNAERVSSSAYEAGNLVLRTLREFHYRDELGLLTRQVQAITDIYKLANKTAVSMCSTHSFAKVRLHG